jgi:imidazolonepropionase-like amidohydrolase
VSLPGGDYVDLFADGDRWTDDPVGGAELVAEGWLLPGLVDAHTHPGAEQTGKPLDEAVLRDDLRAHVAAGVTMIRSPGLAGDPPAWFGLDDDVPRAVHAGPWIAQHGQFFDGWGRRADHAEMPAVAAAQAARSGWAKIIADWSFGDEPVPVGVLTAVVEAVHAVGGRVAVHAQHAAGGAAAVAAGADSLEHGMCLDPELLPRMAEQGIALTPTLQVLTATLDRVRERPDSPRKDWYMTGASAHPALVTAAAEAGVTILAGTDSRPHGRVADEIRALAAAGLGPHDALAAGSWSARSYLGLDGLTPGAPADAVVYDADPRTDLAQLDAPHAVILRGRLIRRAGLGRSQERWSGQALRDGSCGSVYHGRWPTLWVGKREYAACRTSVQPIGGYVGIRAARPQDQARRPEMRFMPYDFSITAARADALFASALQHSDEPSAGQVRQAVAAAIHAYGDLGCAARVAQAYGEHPETAVTRMRWARAVIDGAFGSPQPEPVRPPRSTSAPCQTLPGLTPRTLVGARA